MRALTFSGIWSKEVFELMPGFIVDYEPKGKPAGDQGKDETLVVEALAPGGESLATTHLPVADPCGYPAADGPQQAVAKVAVGCVEFPEDARGIRVSLGGRVLLERKAKNEDGFRPEIKWPEALDKGKVTVEWAAEGDDLAAVLGYSNDDGRTWRPLSLPSSSRTIEFDADDLAGTDSGQLQLRVSNGLHSVEILSGYFKVQAKGWRLWLIAPAPGTSRAEDRPVQLMAQAWHMEEHKPGFDGIFWSSSINGALGEGAAIEVTLSPGHHILIATRGGLAAETSIKVVATT